MAGILYIHEYLNTHTVWQKSSNVFIKKMKEISKWKYQMLKK